MESPLTAFLYVLIRDHLPAGTVRWMIQQAQFPGDPATDLPELETLADRLADELRAAPPRNGNSNGRVVPDSQIPDDTAPVIPPLSTEGGPFEEVKSPEAGGPDEESPFDPVVPIDFEPPAGDFKAQITAYLVHHGGWVSLAEIQVALDSESKGVRAALQKMVRGGEAEAKGHTRLRRYRAVETSESDHDDAVQGSDAAAVGAGGPDEGAAEESDDAANAPDVEAAAPGSRARSADETDVELMARVGDYVKEQGPQEVYPGEIEGVFGIDVARRRKIIEMLANRNRIEVRGAGGPRVRYVYQANPNRGMPVSDFGLTDPLPPSSGLKLRDKVAVVPVEVDPANAEQIRAWCRGQGSFRKRAAIESFESMDPDEVIKILRDLCQEGILEIGEQETYMVVGWGSKKDTIGREIVNGRGGETLEGKLMAWMPSVVTADQAAAHLGTSRDEVVILLDRLVTEGMISRTRRSAEGVTYSPV